MSQIFTILLQKMNRRNKNLEQVGVKSDKFAGEDRRLLAFFEKVRSEADCVTVLTSQGLLGESGLDRLSLDLLLRLCLSMRVKGMAMEPNLIGRAATRNILDRSLAGAASLEFASSDTDFLDLIAAGDADRDRADYSVAQYAYWRALQMFPAHPGYLLQYGHCLKEVKLLPDALVAYIDAYRFGVEKQEFEIHALDTARLLGRFEQVMRLTTKIPQPPTDKPPTVLDWELTSTDVITLTQLFHLNTPSPQDIIDRMCKCRNRRELILALLDEPQFSRTHRNILRIVSETGLM